MPSIVKEASAMFVATTHLRAPVGAGSKILELHRAEVEAYKVSLAMEPASAFVIMEQDELEDEDKEYKLHKVTASAYEAQDYSYLKLSATRNELSAFICYA